MVLIPVKIHPKILAQTCKPYVDLRTNLRIGQDPDPERKFSDSEIFYHLKDQTLGKE